MPRYAAELTGSARDIQLCEVLQAVAAWQLMVEEESTRKNLVAVLHPVFDIAAAESIQVGQVAGRMDNGLLEDDALNCLVFATVAADQLEQPQLMCCCVYLVPLAGASNATMCFSCASATVEARSAAHSAPDILNCMVFSSQAG